MMDGENWEGEASAEPKAAANGDWRLATVYGGNEMTIVASGLELMAIKRLSPIKGDATKFVINYRLKQVECSANFRTLS